MQAPPPNASRPLIFDGQDAFGGGTHANQWPDDTLCQKVCVYSTIEKINIQLVMVADCMHPIFRVCLGLFFQKRKSLIIDCIKRYTVWISFL